MSKKLNCKNKLPEPSGANIHTVYESASEPCQRGKYGHYLIDKTAGPGYAGDTHYAEQRLNVTEQFFIGINQMCTQTLTQPPDTRHHLQPPACDKYNYQCMGPLFGFTLGSHNSTL